MVLSAILSLSIASPGIPNFHPLDLIATTSVILTASTSQSTTAQTLTPSHVTTPIKTSSTIPSVIPSKTAVPDCNYQVCHLRPAKCSFYKIPIFPQGLPSTRLLEHEIGAKYTSTVVGCQTDCEVATGCESYQYRKTGNTYYANCELHPDAY